MGMHEHDYANVTIEFIKEEMEKAENCKPMNAHLKFLLTVLGIILLTSLVGLGSAMLVFCWFLLLAHFPNVAMVVFFFLVGLYIYDASKGE